MNILAKYYETSTCRTCRMHENCSPNVDQSKRKSLKNQHISLKISRRPGSCGRVIFTHTIMRVTCPFGQVTFLLFIRLFNK